MDNIQEKEIPYELFKAVEKIDYNLVLKNIADNHDLHINQSALLDRSLKEYIFGDIDADTFEASLASITNNNKEDFKKLLDDVNSKIIEPVRDMFLELTVRKEILFSDDDFEDTNSTASIEEIDHQALYDAGIEIEGFVPKAPERKYGEEIFPNEDLSVHEKMLSEELTKIKPKEVLEIPKKPEIIPQNFMEQKLGGVVRNTSSNSDQSLPSIAKKEVEKFDPYREKV